MEYVMKVSVIIPLYNSERTIAEAISSVLMQTYDNIECLVIDDGSSDESMAIAKQFELQYSCVKVLHHNNHMNLGVSATRNKGIICSSGDIIAFLDADDIWRPNKIEKCVEPFRIYNDVVFVYHKSTLMGLNRDCINEVKYCGSGKPGYRVSKFPDIFIDAFYPPTSSVTVRREVIQKAGLFDESWHYGEDGLLWYKILQYGNMYYYDEPLACYRIHDFQWNASATGEIKAYRRIKFYLHFSKICEPLHRSVARQCIIDHGARLVFRWALSGEEKINHHMQKIMSMIDNKCVRSIGDNMRLYVVLVHEIIRANIRRIFRVLKAI
jgi:glycosyltransferase involved in cell wall biosynthesis